MSKTIENDFDKAVEFIVESDFNKNLNKCLDIVKELDKKDKEIEIPDVAQWEETDSELAKYKIQALNGLVNSYKRQNEYLETSIEHIEQVNKKLYERIEKAIKYIKTHSNCGGSVQEGKFIIEHIEEIYDGMKLLDILRGNNENE